MRWTIFLIVTLWAEAFCLKTLAFHQSSCSNGMVARTRLGVATRLAARPTMTKVGTFDPLGFASSADRRVASYYRHPATPTTAVETRPRPVATAAVVATTTALVPFEASAQVAGNKFISQGTMNPDNFQPVCPASDGFYRVLQSTTTAVVGEENFVEYGPLISGGLLRIRLELCVVESFFKEAIGPFIQQNGLSWILPLHETVETFLAGSIFALATTFILIGSTKIVTVVLVYMDILVGLPFRLFGGFAFDRAVGKPVTLDVGFGPFKTRIVGPPKPKEGEAAVSEFDLTKASPLGIVLVAVSGTARIIGQVLGFVREVFEAFDLFVGRYLVIGATGYILLKFVHFKIFPDFP